MTEETTLTRQTEVSGKLGEFPIHAGWSDTGESTRPSDAGSASPGGAATKARVVQPFNEELLGLISHELGVPLTIILGNVVRLRRSVTPQNVEDMDSLEAIEEHTLRLQRILLNMLALARFATDEPAVTEPVDLDEVIRLVIQRFTRARPHRHVELKNQLGRIFVLSERTSVEQIVENLLTNADKYGSPTEPLEVSVKGIGEFAEVSVRDFGMTLSPGRLEELFVPFFRSPLTLASKPGIGLGLTVCKRLVELHGGTISAAAAPGGGSIFCFTLPLDAVPAE